jgi:23S rRNA (uracil1939-C5)-methyltransferase
MHWDLAAQRRAKLELLSDQLRRLGRREQWPAIGLVAGDGLGWRTRVEWLAGAWRSGAVLGYRAPRSHDLVEVEHCPILAPALRDLMAGVRDGSRSIPRQARAVQACVDDAAGAAFSAQDAAGEPLDARDSARLVRRRVAGVDLEFPLLGFQQGNGDLLERFVARAIDGLAAASRADGGEVLDLYCGSGLFSLPLAAAGARTLGVEADRAAVRAARSNAARLGLDAARFEVAEARAWLANSARIPAVVLVDPPRTGLGEAVVRELVRLRPRVLRHVSCDAATLARDAGELVRAGWTCTRVDLVDMFPHTAHMEIVLDLELRP